MKKIKGLMKYDAFRLITGWGLLFVVCLFFSYILIVAQGETVDPSRLFGVTFFLCLFLAAALAVPLIMVMPGKPTRIRDIFKRSLRSLATVSIYGVFCAIMVGLELIEIEYLIYPIAFFVVVYGLYLWASLIVVLRQP